MPRSAWVDKLFTIDDHPWEGTHEQGMVSMHIEQTNGKHLAVWAYKHTPQEYMVVEYEPNKFTGPDEERWLGPLEAFAVCLEAAKFSILKPSKKRS